MPRSSRQLAACALGLLALAAGLASPIGASAQPSSEGAAIKIGVSAPLTGDGASYGADIRNGAVFANERLAHNKYQLEIEDDQCSSKAAVSVAHRLADVVGVRYVVGYGCSGTLLAAAPIFEQSKVVTIGTAVSAPAISDAGEYIFRTWPSDVKAIEVLYPHLARKYKTVGVLSEQTDFAQGLANALNEKNKNGALTLVSLSYLPGTTDFRGLLSKMRAARVEAVFLNPQSEVPLIPMYRQLLELGLSLPVYTNYNGGNPEFIRTFGEKANGVIFFDMPPIDRVANASGKAVYDEFVAKYGQPKSSSLWVIMTMAGFAALDEAIASGHDVREYLYSHKFSQVIDNLGFDSKGDPTGVAMILKKLAGGAAEPLDD